MNYCDGKQVDRRFRRRAPTTTALARGTSPAKVAWCLRVRFLGDDVRHFPSEGIAGQGARECRHQGPRAKNAIEFRKLPPRSRAWRCSLIGECSLFLCGQPDPCRPGLRCLARDTHADADAFVVVSNSLLGATPVLGRARTNAAGIVITWPAECNDFILVGGVAWSTEGAPGDGAIGNASPFPGSSMARDAPAAGKLSVLRFVRTDRLLKFVSSIYPMPHFERSEKPASKRNQWIANSRFLASLGMRQLRGIRRRRSTACQCVVRGLKYSTRSIETTGTSLRSTPCRSFSGISVPAPPRAQTFL